MKNTYDEAMFIEDMHMLLHTLTERTILKKQIWNCKKYTPITFIDNSDMDEARAEISHTFHSETSLNGRLFKLELNEAILLPTGKGDITGSIHYENEFGPHLYDFRLSEDLKYVNCTAGNIILQYRGSPIITFSKAVVNIFVKSEVVKNSPCSDYWLMRKEIDYWKQNTNLMQLIEGLMQERNALRFHQIILNKSYRTKLLPQYNFLL